MIVVVASVVAAWMASSDLLVGIDRQTIGALTFSSNWLEIGAGSDYFDHTAPTLFVTFWSLAVEEQFYLFWPAALIGILAVARTAVGRVRVVLGVAVLSAVLMAVWFVPGSNPTRVVLRHRHAPVRADARRGRGPRVRGWRRRARDSGAGCDSGDGSASWR